MPRPREATPDDLIRSFRGDKSVWIGQFVGHSDLATTANTYTHVLNDGREIDHVALLADA